MKIYFAALSLVFFMAVNATAEEYKSITTAGYSNLDFNARGGDELSTESTYYFSGKETLGPLREFEFINKASNLSGAYYHRSIGSTNSDSFAIAGEYFAENGFVLGANIADLGGESFNTIALGYMFTPNFLMKFYNTDGNTYSKFRYNYDLNETDYIGFDFSADIVFDWQIFSSKYFSKIGDVQYISIEFSYLNYNEWDDFWEVGSNYYFTKSTSLGASYDENNDYKVGLSHFFNRNVAVEASYSTRLGSPFKYSSFGSDIYKNSWNTDTEVDKFELGVTVQF
ncbi:putative porin [Microbulbifer sp. VAAF005]|uniref:putative porin n=1 Tax=Microbulbifer sp. VAAF005 TaxID=3034230 RepID=UPI0024ACFAAE|nr:putative porin [Microbulbifer sp. VAAF005]WHI49013.1 putative porin [Microbulbifer sp. VAAF005]